MGTFYYQHYGDINDPNTWGASASEWGSWNLLIEDQPSAFVWAINETSTNTLALGSFDQNAPSTLCLVNSMASVEAGNYIGNANPTQARYSFIYAFGNDQANVVDSGIVAGASGVLTAYLEQGSTFALNESMGMKGKLTVEGPGSLSNESIYAEMGFVTINSHMLGDGYMTFGKYATVNIDAAVDYGQRLSFIGGRTDFLVIDNLSLFHGILDMSQSAQAPLIEMFGDGGINNAWFSGNHLFMTSTSGHFYGLTVRPPAGGFNLYNINRGVEITSLDLGKPLLHVA